MQRQEKEFTQNPQQIAGLSTQPLRNLVCPFCGKTFVTTKRNVKYCTNWCRNRANVLAGHRIRTQRERNGRHSQREWSEKLKRCGYTCFWCGCSLIDSRGMFSGCKDHFTPLARGGRNDIENIVPSCGPCNDRKKTKSATEFAREISEDSTVTPFTTEQWRLAGMQLVEDLATRKAMHNTIGLPAAPRRRA